MAGSGVIEGTLRTHTRRAAGALTQVDAAWREVEPELRAWVAEADTLTEPDWQDESESTHELYDRLRRMTHPDRV